MYKCIMLTMLSLKKRSTLTGCEYKCYFALRYSVIKASYYNFATSFEGFCNKTVRCNETVSIRTSQELVSLIYLTPIVSIVSLYISLIISLI